MIEKMHSNLDKKEGYAKPKGDAVMFAIAHYAGRVSYEGQGFLEKNRDALPIDILSVMRASENDLLSELFGASDEDKKERKTKNKLSGKVSLR
jgi:myosin-3